MVLLFVYGSLRFGMSNNWRLDCDTYVGLYKTKDSYFMVGQTSKSYPFVSRNQIFPNTSPSQIVGEIYDVSPTTLASLDLLEDHPNKYVRQLVPIESDSEPDKCVHIYLLESSERIKEIQTSTRFVPVESGDWITFCAV